MYVIPNFGKKAGERVYMPHHVAKTLLEQGRARLPTLEETPEELATTVGELPPVTVEVSSPAKAKTKRK